MKPANRQPAASKFSEKETETRAHIRELRQQINAGSRDDIRPFTTYKIITYLCTLLFPLVPLALYRIWCVSPNVDFFSGFAYSMLNLPLELYTPIFAIARISGWSAHRLEELNYNGKIMRPAYKNVQEHLDYIPMSQR